MKLLQSHRRVPWLTATSYSIRINIALTLVAVGEKYNTTSLSKVS